MLQRTIKYHIDPRYQPFTFVTVYTFNTAALHFVVNDEHDLDVTFRGSSGVFSMHQPQSPLQPDKLWGYS